MGVAVRGVISAARVPVVGRANVARYLLGLMTTYGRGVSLDVVESNGQEAVLVRWAGSVVALCAIDASPEGIARVLIVLNPATLTGFGPAEAGPRQPAVTWPVGRGCR